MSEKQERMTAEERAIRIHGHPCCSQCFANIRAICDQIKEAEAQAREEWYEAARNDLAAIHGAKWAKEDYEKGWREAREAARNVAKVSADYYALHTKREDGTFNQTIGSAAQTSWDIAEAIAALQPPSGEGR